jgi:hypothetical protein
LLDGHSNKTRGNSFYCRVNDGRTKGGIVQVSCTLRRQCGLGFDENHFGVDPFLFEKAAIPRVKR